MAISNTKLNNQTSSLLKAQPIAGNRPDYWLLSILAMLLLLGTVMIYSASFVTAELATGNGASTLYRHLMWLAVGLIAMFVTMQIDYHRLRAYSILGMVGVLVALFAVLVLPESIAPNIAGAKRWITFTDSWQFQPSEFAKLALILYAAHWLSSKGDKVRNFYYGLVPFALTVGILIALVMGEPDLGTSLVIGVLGLGMFFVAGANILHLVVGLAVAGGAFWVLINLAAYRLNRLQAFLDPFADPTGASYHTFQALLGLGSGGWFGVGLGASRGKFLWLPTVYTDSIFAVIGEELGLVGTGLIVLLFVALGWRGFYIALHAPDGFGRLIATGVTITVIFQAFLNMAVISNLVPFTGIPLPFISYGGSSLVVKLISIGLLLNVSKQMVDNPRLVELEEQRQEERQRREFLRAQRQAERERRMAQSKLREDEQIERDKLELSEAETRWREKVVRQKADEDWRSLLQKEYQRQKEVETSRGNRGQSPLLQQTIEEDLPGPAVKSFLEFSGQKVDISGLEGLDSEEKPKLRRPRRDWAKVYDNMARRRERD